MNQTENAPASAPRFTLDMSRYVSTVTHLGLRRLVGDEARHAADKYRRLSSDDVAPPCADAAPLTCAVGA